MTKILLFDDDLGNQTFIAEQVKQRAGNSVVLEVYSGEDEPERGLTYELFIERQLEQRAEEIGLIACDQELGMYRRLPGLSANTIGVVARNLGIPFCQYSQHPRANEREISRFRALQRWNSEEITLAGGRDSWASEIVELWAGFERLRMGYREQKLHSLKPAAALASLMGRAEVDSRIKLYGSGDQAVMTEIFGFVEDGGAESLQQRMPRVLGMWLRLSLLRFPGLLLDSTAAASYLNVSVADFKRDEIRRHFQTAMYDGPFSGLSAWWWRTDLDNILLEEEKDDGRALLAARGVSVSECLDQETNDRAGYYCMITESAVSRRNSIGNINWFPSGADLARIRKSKYDQITSLVSL